MNITLRAIIVGLALSYAFPLAYFLIGGLAMNLQEAARLAEQLLALPEGEASRVIDNGYWKFVVHRYRDCWWCLWDASVFAAHGEKLGRDIGREFRDPVDFIEFVLGHTKKQHVLEAMDRYDA